MTPIPKIIHYCWFGQKPLPDSALRCMDSWRRFAPDYTLRRWDETNFDVNALSYTAEAYKARKFAFVSDVARLRALSDYGGLYLDTDVELLRSPEPLVTGGATIGFESSGLLSTAVISAEKGNRLLAEFLTSYHGAHFILSDGRPDLTPNTQRITQFMAERGLMVNGEEQTVGQFSILPSEILSPLCQEGYRLYANPRTICIHHFESSWQSRTFRFKRRIQRLIGPTATVGIIRAKRFLSSL